MENSHPIITVVIPTFNRGESLLATLTGLSVQTLDHHLFEIVVVDDGSTDKTVEMLERWRALNDLRITLLSQKNSGPAAARNNGVAAARGYIIAFTDDDCIPDPDWLAEVLESFKQRRWIGVQGSTYTQREEITPLTHQIDNEWGNPSVPTCNAAYLKQALTDCGGFDVKFPYPHNEDADLAWRLQEMGTIGFSHRMRVCHPPRTDRFAKVAKRMKMMESEFRLYYKNPRAYQQNRSRSPWYTIYWLVGVKTQWYYLKNRFRYIGQPWLMIQGLALTTIWSLDLLWRLPRFMQVSQACRKRFENKTLRATTGRMPVLVG